jgi:pimeloyl-ACP methyl ester carboxylesterase
MKAANGRELRVSGLLALPHDGKARRLMSFQHGTTTTRDEVPSAPDSTGEAAAIVFAGNGYAVIAPDYIGLGHSPGKHPYLVAEDAAAAVTAMIAAARRIDGVPHGPVFLSGFSQGGQATIAAMRALEASGETVLGAAPVAGPYDLRHISLAAALKGGSPNHALYLAYMSWGYAARYDHPLDSALTPHWAKVAANLFEKPHTPEEIIAALPPKPREMFNDEFLHAFDTNGEHWLLTALAASDLSDYRPKGPVRLYYGSADPEVIPAEALSAEKKMRTKGADVRAVDVGPFAHNESMLAAAPKIMAWLKELDRP